MLARGSAGLGQRSRCAGLAPARRWGPAMRGRSRRAVRVAAWGKKPMTQTSQAVPSRPLLPTQLPAQLAAQPWFVQAGAAVLLLVASLKVFKKLTNKGSMGSLESRGLVLEGEQSTRSSDAYYNRMMKGYNTVQYQELSEEQISAARQRRSQDRRNDERVDLTKIQLPSNHPFAVSKQVSDEEEALQMARLGVRRGMPLKDLGELRQRQGGGRQQQQQALGADFPRDAARAGREGPK